MHSIAELARCSHGLFDFNTALFFHNIDAAIPVFIKDVTAFQVIYRYVLKRDDDISVESIDRVSNLHELLTCI